MTDQSPSATPDLDDFSVGADAGVGVGPKSAVIFGGSGFIGSHLVARLLQDECEVTTVDLVPPAQPHAGSHVTWDVRQPIPAGLLPPVEVIFNLAAVHRTPGHADTEYYDTNVTGASNVVRWAEDNAVNRICFTSSISVYGPTEDGVNEGSPRRPTTAYGNSKALAEDIHALWQSHGPHRQLVTVRPAAIFGPGEHGNFTRLAGALRSRRFLYPGRTDTIKACGYVEDLVQSMLFVLSLDDTAPIYNFCYPVEYTAEQICQSFHQVAGYPTPLKVPSVLISPLLMASHWDRLGPLAHLLQRVGKLTTSTNVRPAFLEEHGFEWSTDFQSALEAWQTTTSGQFA